MCVANSPLHRKEHKCRIVSVRDTTEGTVFNSRKHVLNARIIGTAARVEITCHPHVSPRFSGRTCGDQEQFPYRVVEKLTDNKGLPVSSQQGKGDAIWLTTQNCLEIEVECGASPARLFLAHSMGTGRSSEEAAHIHQDNLENCQFTNGRPSETPTALTRAAIT